MNKGKVSYSSRGKVIAYGRSIYAIGRAWHNMASMPDHFEINVFADTNSAKRELPNMLCFLAGRKFVRWLKRHLFEHT